MKIDLMSFNSTQKFFCHVSRQVDSPQFPPDSLPSFPCSSKINRNNNYETNSDIFRSTPAQTHSQNHPRTHLPKHSRDLVSHCGETIRKIADAALNGLFGEDQLFWTADIFMAGCRS
jgi:hypothetical protein